MKISIVCSDKQHPIYPRLETWAAAARRQHQVELVQTSAQLSAGDLLFLISCHEIVRAPTRERYRKSLVIHASDLPEGRGWSPLVWAVLEGAREVVVTLFEADDGLDTGPIWHKLPIRFEGHELFDEINTKLFEAELMLMNLAVDNFASVRPAPQPAGSGKTFPRRKPEDSRIDPYHSIAEQFAALRVADPERYPAFFDLEGHRYAITLRKIPS